MSGSDRLIFVAYNVIWWVPVVMAPLGLMSYSFGFLSFLVITVLRALANLYRMNVLPIEKAQNFTLRSP